MLGVIFSITSLLIGDGKEKGERRK